MQCTQGYTYYQNLFKVASGEAYFKVSINKNSENDISTNLHDQFDS